MTRSRSSSLTRTAALDEVAASKADPVLAQAAQALVAALAADTSGAVESAKRAHETVTSLLEGHPPAAVALAAEEVGVLAREGGLLPAAKTDGWTSAQP